MPKPDEFRAYLQVNTEYYIKRFAGFEAAGGSYRFTWNFAAFLVPVWWCLYRKLYVSAVFFFFIRIEPLLYFLFMPVMGLTANYLIYKKAVRSIDLLEKAFPHASARERGGRLGGVHTWVPPTAIFVEVLYVYYCLRYSTNIQLPV